MFKRMLRRIRIEWSGEELMKSHKRRLTKLQGKPKKVKTRRFKRVIRKNRNYYNRRK